MGGGSATSGVDALRPRRAALSSSISVASSTNANNSARFRTMAEMAWASGGGEERRSGPCRGDQSGHDALGGGGARSLRPPARELAKNRTNDLTEYWGGVGIVSPVRAADNKGETVMPRYLFHLSDGKDTFIDDTGKELGDSPAAHAHALRIIEKIRRLMPDADKSTWKIRIMSTSGRSMLTVISPGVEGLPQRPFGRRVAPANDSQEPSL
jgi:hypothetical protein